MHNYTTINKTIDKKEIKTIINWFIENFGSIKTTKLLDKLKLLGFKYATKIGTSLGTKDLRIPKTKQKLILNNEREINKLRSKITKGEIDIIEYERKLKEKWNQTNQILTQEINDNFRRTDLLNPIYVMVISGARGNISQIKQLVGMRGLMVDPKGEVINIPIKSNLKEALNIIEYFISCYGARKGVIDTAIKTAVSGHLTRKLIYLVQDQIIKRPNCNTRDTEIILNSKKNKHYYQLSLEKITGRVLSRDIKHKNLILSEGQDICNYLARKIMHTKKIFLRSPLTCKVNHGLCQLCYGWNLASNRLVELGEAVGIIAAQSIGEPGTQLTMRTFHTGGIFTSEIDETITSPSRGTIYYNANKDKRIIKLNQYSKNLLTLSEKKILIIDNKQKRFLIKLPKFSLLFVKNKEKISEKQIIGEILKWKEVKNKITEKINKKNIKGIKSRISGKLTTYKDTIKDKNKQVCIINGNILTEYKLKTNLENIDNHKLKNILKKKENKNYNPNIKNVNTNKKIIIKITSFKKITNLANFNKENNKKKLLISNKFIIQKNNIKENKIITSKIRNTKTIKKKEIDSSNKKLNIGKIYCSKFIEKRKDIITTTKVILYKMKQANLIQINKKNLIKKGTNITYTPYKSKKTKDIVQGLPKIEEILENKKSKQQKILDSILKKLKKKNKRKIAIKKSIYKIRKHLVKKVQTVYHSQGIKISNKHIEIIIKKITSKGIINYQGESNFIHGEIIDINKIEKINKKLNKKMLYDPLIIGISKSSKINNSFISNSCFQGTVENLTKSAIEGRIDWLNGIKENIVLGNLIPVGTGINNNYK